MGGMTDVPDRTPITRLSTHVLDAALGRPADGIPVVLESVSPDGGCALVGEGVTDADGRVQQVNSAALPPGEYRLSLATASYFTAHHGTVFYPAVAVAFILDGARPHYHIAVLASTFSYTTYRGS